MLHLIYLICIAPIEFCMRIVFEGGYGLTHSYGLALIGVSLVVGTATLPIYNQAERWQEEERALKKRMAPRERMIRGCFRGQERFAMLSTLYRQAGYSPFMTLRASIGVLLQIPFFFAAYDLLSHMQALNGVRFGPIRDLGAPDALLNIGGFSINLLPLLMTAVNVCSAHIYSRGLSRRDKLQLYGMATLFLVLLYNSPAALTFYWTLNNLYSLAKNVIEKDWMKRPWWTETSLKLTQTSARLGHGLGRLLAGIAKLCVHLSVIAILTGVAAFSTLVFNYRGHSFWLGVLLFAWLLLVVLAIFIKRGSKHALWMKFPKACAMLAAIFASTYIIARYGIDQGNIFKVIVRLLLLAAALWGVTNIRKLWHRIDSAVLSQKEELAKLYLPSSSLLAFLTFVYCPFMVFSSDPSQFTIGLDEFASGRLGTCLVVLISLAVLGMPLRKIRWLLGCLFTIMGTAALAFCFVVAPNVGAMDAFILQNNEPLHYWYNLEIDLVVCIGVVFLFVLALVLRKLKAMAIFVYASLTILVLMTGVHYQSAKEVIEEFSSYPYDLSVTSEVPQKLKEFFTFSKKGKNIVVVMLDMFTGGNMNQLFERHPTLKKELDGFIWYEDVVTGGTRTIFGKPGILGGEMAHPIMLNEDSSKTLEEKITQSYIKFFRELQEHNFSISIYDDTFLSTYYLPKALPKPEKTNLIKARYLPLWPELFKQWRAKHYYEIKDALNHHAFFDVIGLYNIAPRIAKYAFYSKGSWKNTISKTTYDSRYAAIQLVNLALPRYVSTVSDSDENRFIYFINYLTHEPWALDENGLPDGERKPDYDRNMANYGLSEAHLRVEYFALQQLIEWFDWMKKNGVYNNTQIIIVSDHGSGDSANIVKIWNAIPPVRVHGLLLVKEPDAHGELRIDRVSQMANWDVPTIILNGILTDNSLKKFPWREGFRKRLHVAGDWRRTEHPKNVFTFDKIYNIQGPLYKKESWVKIK